MLIHDILSGKIKDSVYIIAEIGQNHQGCLATAKRLIYEAKKSGAHCVKFQKSCLTKKFTRSALNREYKSKNSWGSTYGEHKEFLEFSERQYYELQAYSHGIGIDFTASAMDERSLEFLAEIKVPFIKIGSGDANNFPLLSQAAELGIPLVISTGMQDMSTVDKIVDIMKKAGKHDYALMHCVSAYPTAPKNCNLQLIPLLMNRFPDVVIGYSGHELGIVISQAAALLGARIIERHFTLDKNQKGSDHACSLVPEELCLLVSGMELLKRNQDFSKYTASDILKTLNGGTDLEQALKNVETKCILDCELPCRNKLGKSLVAARDLKKGKHIIPADIIIKVSEPCGLTAEKYFHILDMVLGVDVKEDQPIRADMLVPTGAY